MIFYSFFVGRISNHKVLVFGGIDPYCWHSQHVQPQLQHQQLQKGIKKLQKQQQQQHHQEQEQDFHLHSEQELRQRRRVHSIDSIIMSTSTHLHPLRSHQMATYGRANAKSYSTNAVAPKNLDNFGDHVLCYDIDASEWRHLSHIPFGSRHHHAVVVCNGLIYVIGGTRTSLGCTKKTVCIKYCV